MSKNDNNSMKKSRLRKNSKWIQMQNKFTIKLSKQYKNGYQNATVVRNCKTQKQQQ